MNVTSIELWSTSDWGSTQQMYAQLSLSQASQTDSYLIKSVSGLDNAEIIPRYYGSGSSLLYGYQYYGMVPPPRVVSFLIKLNPQGSVTVGQLRDDLQRMISSSRRGSIEIRFKNQSTTVAVLYGLITKFESSIFTSDAEVQITFTCNYPFLKAPTFTDLINTSTPGAAIYTINDNVSTAPHGIRMELQFTSSYSATSFTVQGIYDTTVAPFTINYTFQNGDKLYINSEEENKSVYVLRGTSTTYLADKLSANSVWPIIFPGANSLGFPNFAFNWLDLKYKALYWGI